MDNKDYLECRDLNIKELSEALADGKVEEKDLVEMCLKQRKRVDEFIDKGISLINVQKDDVEDISTNDVVLNRGVSFKRKIEVLILLYRRSHLNLLPEIEKLMNNLIATKGEISYSFVINKIGELYLEL